MAPKPRFIVGEKVLCFHGPLLYEAKCLRSQVKEKYVKYFIHYSGWNKRAHDVALRKNWDEWVPECRVLKYDDSNLEKQKELYETHNFDCLKPFQDCKKSKTIKMTPKKDIEKDVAGPSTSDKIPSQRLEKKLEALSLTKKEMDKAALDPPNSLEKPSTSKIEKRPGSAASSDSEQVETTKKCKKDIKTETNNEDNSLKVKITLPDALKDWILDDFDLVNRQKKIVQLPARITVDHILANYVRERVSTKALTKVWEDSVVDFSNRMRELFNVSLGKSLLYKFERPQYSQMLKDHKEIKMCQLYGAAHLTRLVCKIGDMLTSIREETQDRTPPGYFVNQVEDFLKFIASKESLYLSADDYMVAAPEYHRQALT